MDAEALQKLCRMLDGTLAQIPDLEVQDAVTTMGAVLDTLEAEYRKITDNKSPY